MRSVVCSMGHHFWYRSASFSIGMLHDSLRMVQDRLLIVFAGLRLEILTTF